jgi:argininosuccinate synthase
MKMFQWKKYDKIVLAYSGGLDTTVAIPYLKEKTGAAIYAVGVDVGQNEDLEPLRKKGLSAGAEKCQFVDATEEFADGYILPSLKANALYEGEYPLLSALSRPIICAKLAEAAVEYGADAVAHGCTGKGNDQIRFEMGLAALVPDAAVLAPARHWGFTRDDSMAFAEAHGIKVNTKKSTYSIDENIWGRAIECGDMEDAWLEPPNDAFTMTKSVAEAPDEPEYLTIEFDKGVPVAVNGKPYNFLNLVAVVNKIAGEHGIGRIDHVESRVVGIKSREVYECPAAMTLIAAHKALEKMVFTRDLVSAKAHVDAQWAALVYEGKFFSQVMNALNAFIENTQKLVNGTVRLKMFKGGLAVVGRKSPNSLYDAGLATYGAADPFDHSASEGFVKIYAMETATLARMKAKAAKPKPKKTVELVNA